MELIVLPLEWQGETEYFLEGAVLASNMAAKPLEPESWCALAGVDADEAQALLTPRINKQYNELKRSEYSLATLNSEQLSDLAEGFMSIWPTIESQYQEIELGDGSLRMLQALLTTMMLAIDEEQTRSEMRASGIGEPPELADLLPQLDLMLNEVAQAADELMVGARGQSVNPYKNIGRNDKCPCGSGKKFKQCCGK